MKIKNIIDRGDKLFSFEFFPPKTEKGEENLFRAIEELKIFNPHYVSVTYGALGTTQDKSLAVIERIKNDIGLNVMAHYTCIGATEEKVDSFLAALKKLGVDNIYALRGDAPLGSDIEEVLSDSPFRYGSDLVHYIKKKTDYFSIGVAAYPETHPEAKSAEEDLIHLKEKVEQGADFIITQLFFDNRYFFDFIKRARTIGIKVPIIPGIMPLENFKQIEKITSMCGSKIPKILSDYFGHSDISEEDKLQYGLEYSVKQCQELLREGADGLHFYTLNRSTITKKIVQELRTV